ncbi:MAG: hypothetical protein E7050_03925 [Lentisphaerae bacterium]|nr:hypothetical protein [Lentisphaerota bacterium]
MMAITTRSSIRVKHDCFTPLKRKLVCFFILNSPFCLVLPVKIIYRTTVNNEIVSINNHN